MYRLQKWGQMEREPVIVCNTLRNTAITNSSTIKHEVPNSNELLETLLSSWPFDGVPPKHITE